MRNNEQSGAAPTRKGRPLGSITKSASRASVSDDKILKFYLQSVARELAPHHRIRNCLRAHIPKTENIEVWFGAGRKTAYYKNLMRCGSIWMCPLCASAITEKRQNELSEKLCTTETIHILMDDKVERVLTVPRWHLGLATFTIRHRAGVSLANVLHTLENAYKRCWGGRWAVAWKRRYNIVGTIRALEVTHGENGWHPHIHTLLIRDSQNTPATTLQIELDLQFRWDDCVSLAGGVVDPIHGVDYRAAAANAYEYISKLGVSVIGNATRWNAISELVKYPVKAGRKGSLTVWDFLALYAAGDTRAGDMWIEAQRNLKGRRHIVASRGLYDLLGAYQNSKSDEELSIDTQSNQDILLASLTSQEWRKVITKDMRGQVIAVASRGDRKLLIDFLESIL